MRYNELATSARTLGDAVIIEADAEIARLRIELDRYQGRRVLFTTDAALDQAAIASMDEEPGTILRATDTGRELVLADGTWEPATI
jgi:hypothetical protein